MKKKLWILGFSLVTMILVGCGQVSQETGGGVEEPTSQVEIKETVVASTKLTISLTGNEGSGYQTSAIQTSRIATQSVEIEANVQGFMTFDVNSTISFDVDQLAWIEANGYIQINVTYNKLMEDTLQNCRVRAYMVGADGLVGQINASNIIPLEVEVTAPPMHTPYSPLTTTTKNIKQWDKPFNEAINEVILLKLKGDFRRALNQQFKGTIMLEFVRDDEVVEDDNTVLLLHMDGDALVDSSSNEYPITVLGTATQSSIDKKFGDKSLLLNTTSLGLSIPDSNDWYIDNGSFTFDCWVNFKNYSGTAYHSVFAQRVDATNRWGLDYLPGDPGFRYYHIGGGRSYTVGYYNFTPSNNTWYHIALVKDGSNVDMYVNGNKIGTTFIDNEGIPDYSSPLLVGYDATHDEFDGYIDELRISKGVARWTSDFTPPTAPY
jgi:hypothetical protein